jgi:hypothetical protein
MTEPVPAPTTKLADQIAARLAEQLLNDPELLDAIADRLASRITSTAATSRSDRDLDAEPPRAAAGSDLERQVTQVAELMQRQRPDLIDGDPVKWARSLVSAAGTSSASAVLAWALADSCPTSVWRRMRMPIPGPRGGKRARHGVFTQMLAEYRATQHKPSAAASVDRVVDGIGAAVLRFSGTESQQQLATARRSALEILRTYDFDAEKVVTIVTWGMGDRPHWRSAVTGVPAKATFKKIHGDWVSAGNDVAAIPAELERTVCELEKGWKHYYAKRIRSRHIETTPKTRTRLIACLTGSDGADPISCRDLQNFIRWVTDPATRSGSYLLNGSPDFPEISKVRRGLMQMSERPTGRSSTAVTATNNAAAAGITYGAAVEEV